MSSSTTQVQHLTSQDTSSVSAASRWKTVLYTTEMSMHVLLLGRPSVDMIYVSLKLCFKTQIKPGMHICVSVPAAGEFVPDDRTTNAGFEVSHLACHLSSPPISTPHHVLAITFGSLKRSRVGICSIFACMAVRQHSAVSDKSRAELIGKHDAHGRC